jgi:1-deoxy-D-xylulose-5-phosphate synthase
MTILDKIKSGAALKDMPAAELPVLAGEIRQLIISTVSKNGGHMASNLGVVELTIALHRVFNSPEDRIIFDVSHQSYTHKILTGRAVDFEKIRTSGGYSGYFDPDESPHDVLALGHAGCGPSLALGIALAETMKGGAGYVVCVIGDGSLTSGLAYEGLSNIVQQNPRNLMIILNDNGMAISPNVGWLANWRNRWLPRLRDELELDKDFHQLEQSAESLAQRLPLGPLVLDLGRGIKSALAKTLTPVIGQIWGEMGFDYLGPLDGHNIDEIVECLVKVKTNADKVPFVHVLTNKGQGFSPAKHDPVRFHQPGPPAPEKKKPTYSKVFTAALGDLMDRDKRIVAISAAMLEGTGLVALLEDFPGRIFDVGICEQHAVSMAAGLARSGYRPVVCIYSTFLQRSFDQILHDVCMNNLPVVFALDRAGIVGQDGKTHHGLYDLAYMRIAPGMVVSVPRDENQMVHLLHTALHQEHPFSIRFPRGEALGVKLEAEPRWLPLGTSEVLHEGTGISLVAVGELVGVALAAAEQLDKEDISAEVIDLRYVKPVDADMIGRMCASSHDVVILEEGTSVGGVNAAVLEAMARRGRIAPRMHHLAVGDIFPDHGEIAELRHEYGLDIEAVINQVRRIAQGGE